MRSTGVAVQALSRCCDVSMKNLGMSCPECGTNLLAGFARSDIELHPVHCGGVQIQASWPLAAVIIIEVGIAVTAGREHVDAGAAIAVNMSVIHGDMLLMGLANQRVAFYREDQASDGSRVPGLFFGSLCAAACTSAILLFTRMVTLL